MSPWGFLLLAVVAILGGSRFVTQHRKRQQRATYPRPESLIIQPPQPTTVTRRADSQLEIRWQDHATSTTLYAGAAPQQIDRSRPVATMTHETGVVIPDPLPGTRPYFEITHDGHAPQIVAERLLPLQAVANMRDIGGYQTVDGRSVRWGRVYRAGSLAGATDSDLAYLHNLDIRLVCDFRTHDEVRTEPDRLPENPRPTALHLALEASINPEEQFQAIMFNPQNLYDLMKEGYTRQMVGANAPILGDSLRHLADPANLPAIIHCTAGKDRTGVAIALLLAVLGVPDDTIIADYSLSNHHFPHLRQYMAAKFKQPFSFIFGVTVDDVQPILTADPALMRYTLDYIRREYGTIEDYLRQQAGLDDATLNALRDNLLR